MEEYIEIDPVNQHHVLVRTLGNSWLVQVDPQQRRELEDYVAAAVEVSKRGFFILPRELEEALNGISEQVTNMTYRVPSKP